MHCRYEAVMHAECSGGGRGGRGRGGGGGTTAERSGVEGRRAEDLRDTRGRLPATRVAVKIVYPAGSWTPTQRVKSAVNSLQKAAQNAGAAPPLVDQSASVACCDKSASVARVASCPLSHDVDSELRALLSPLKYAAPSAGALSLISLIPLSSPTQRKGPQEAKKLEDKVSVCMYVCVCVFVRACVV